MKIEVGVVFDLLVCFCPAFEVTLGVLVCEGMDGLISWRRQHAVGIDSQFNFQLSYSTEYIGCY